jgi:ABC-type cobalamin/Fe3+-siderophores transport system ATPase subunit
MIFLKKGNLIAAGKLIDTLTAPVLREVFDADAKVSEDDFTGGLRLSFKNAYIGHDKNSQDPSGKDSSGMSKIESLNKTLN